MIVLLSPAKTLDFEDSHTKICTQPEFLDFSQNLIQALSKLSSEEIGSLMKLSPKLSSLNHQRFMKWTAQHRPENSKQALLAFKGDVYEGLRAWEFTQDDFKYAQRHLRILSGLYGILKPLDLIQPYRLEMGTVFANPLGKNLYDFWGDLLYKNLSMQMKDFSNGAIINLASQEYAKAVKLNQIDCPVITPVFQDEKKGQFKIISFYAKRARGLMARFIIDERISDLSKLVHFNLNGYSYCKESSTDQSPVFKRPEKAKSAA